MQVPSVVLRVGAAGPGRWCPYLRTCWERCAGAVSWSPANTRGMGVTPPRVNLPPGRRVAGDRGRLLASEFRQAPRETPCAGAGAG